MLLNEQGSVSPARSAEIKKELETSITLDPTLADAYAMLGFTQAFSGEPEKGMATMKKAVALSPRNEPYLFNLASMCLANQKVDDAIVILRSLERSGNAEVAMRANQVLVQAVNFKEQMEANGSHTGNAPIELRLDRSGQAKAEKAKEELVSAPKAAPMLFVKGKLVAVDCSTAPQAALTVTSGTKSFKLHIRDSAHMVLIGEHQFSCAWKNRNVVVSYHERADGEGEVFSVEMQ